MNDEIKEKKTKRIIEKIEGLATYVTIPRELAIYNVNIDSQEAKLLIDYITNLQQEIKHYEETTTFGDYIKEVNLLVDYKSRIEKAVEIAKDLKQFVYDELVDRNGSGATETHDKIINLLNILNGKE